MTGQATYAALAVALMEEFAAADPFCFDREEGWFCCFCEAQYHPADSGYVDPSRNRPAYIDPPHEPACLWLRAHKASGGRGLGATSGEANTRRVPL